MAVKQGLVWAAGIAVLALGAGAVFLFMRGPDAALTTNAGGPVETIKVGALSVSIVRAADGVTVTASHPGGARHVLPLQDGSGARFFQVQLLEPAADMDGDGSPEAVIGLSTGGMGCCLSVAAVPTNGAAPLALLDLGRGMDAAPVSRPGAPGALIALDDGAGSAYGASAFAPMGRVILRWDGARWGFDASAMKAQDGVPAFWTMDPPVAAAVAARSGEDDFLPEDLKNADAVRAGYRAWRDGLMRASADDEMVDASDPETFITAGLALNAYVYAGEAAAGVTALRQAFGPERAGLADAILAHHLAALQDSRFRADLAALNGGALRTTTATAPPKP